MNRDPWKTNDEPGAGDVDPNKLDELVRHVITLKAQGKDNYIDVAMEDVEPTQRDRYRKALVALLAREDLQGGIRDTIDECASNLSSFVSDVSLHPTALESDKKPIVSAGKKSRSGESQPFTSNANVLPKRIGKFSIKKELGRGAFGAVYLGHDEVLERDVAIKVSLTTSEEQRNQMRKEAAKLAKLDSGGIVPVYDTGTTEDQGFYIVQKYIQGETLRDLLKRGPISPAKTALLIREIARSLEPAHEKEILHRDLKPANILIDQTGKPWIADFGLAISEVEQDVSGDYLAGTPQFMSPEQIQGKISFLDGRADIWAIGVMFYEMLCGKLPFTGRDRQSLAQQICERDPKPLQQRNPQLLTDDMNRVFLKCCEKKPSDRFASVGELVTALDGLIALGLPGIDALQGNAFFRSIPGSLHSSSTGLSSSSFAPASLKSVSPPINEGKTKKYWPAVLACLVTVVLGVGVATRFLYPETLRIAETPKPLPSVEPKPVLDPVDPSPDPNVDPKNTTVVEEPSKTESEQKDADNPEKKMDAPPKAPPEIRWDGSKEKPWVVDASATTGSDKTIGAALERNTADPDQTVYISVLPGTYKENFQIKSPTVIQGIDDGKVNVAGTVIVDSKDQLVSLSGITFGQVQGTTVQLISGETTFNTCEIISRGDGCIEVSASSTLTANNCRFTSNHVGVVASDSKQVHLNNCIFDTTDFGIQSTNCDLQVSSSQFQGDKGIQVESTNQLAKIHDCEFSDSKGPGIRMSNGSAIVSQCRWTNCDIPVEILGGNCTFKDECVLDQGITAVNITGSNSSAILDGVLISNFETGINCETGANVSIKNNSQISKCEKFGVKVTDGELVCDETTVSQAGIAIQFAGTKAQLSNTQLNNNTECAFLIKEGQISIDGLTAVGGKRGLYAQGRKTNRLSDTPAVVVTISATKDTRFSGQSEFSCASSGDARVIWLGAIGDLLPVDGGKKIFPVPPSEIVTRTNP